MIGLKVYCGIQSVITLGCIVSAACGLIVKYPDTADQHLHVNHFTTVTAVFGFLCSTIAFSLFCSNCRDCPLRLGVVLLSVAGVVFLNAAVLATLYWTNIYLLVNACFSWAEVICITCGLLFPLGRRCHHTDHGDYVKSFRGVGRILAMMSDVAVITSSGVVLVIPALSSFQKVGTASLIFGTVGIVCRSISFLCCVKRSGISLRKASHIADMVLSVVWIVAYLATSSVFLQARSHPAVIVASVAGYCSAAALLMELCAVSRSYHSLQDASRASPEPVEFATSTVVSGDTSRHDENRIERISRYILPPENALTEGQSEDDAAQASSSLSVDSVPGRVSPDVLEACMELPIVGDAVSMGYARDVVKRAIEQQLQSTGDVFETIEQLLDAVIGIQGTVAAESTRQEPSIAPPHRGPETIVGEPADKRHTETPQEGGSATQDEDTMTTEQIHQLRDNVTCRICMDKQRDMVFLPCRHFIACSTCGSNCSLCPICRQKIAVHQTVIQS